LRPLNQANHAENWRFPGSFGEDSWRNAYAGEREVRPPHGRIERNAAVAKPFATRTKPLARRPTSIWVIRNSVGLVTGGVCDQATAMPARRVSSSRSAQPARVVATNITSVINADAKRTLGLLAAAAVCAAVIALINLAGLLIVRSIDRRRELAVRSALGARHSEIAAQLLLEAIAIVIVGTLGGVLLAVWLTPAAAQL
jgi:hypothetical protein